MKHKFIVDENIFYCAIRSVDEFDKHDTNSARFLYLLRKNCHKIYLDIIANRRNENNIQKKLESIELTDPIKPDIRIVSLINNIFHTSEKIIREFTESPGFPDEEKIPRKDIYLARCANHSSAIIVTLDKEFRDSINAHASLKHNGVKALHPKDAMVLASES